MLFATASAADARNASALLMDDFSDQIRAGDDAARHSRLTGRAPAPPAPHRARQLDDRAGRERPFLASTIPLSLDRGRIEWHARAQEARGGRELREPAPPASVLAGSRVARAPEPAAVGPPPADPRVAERARPAMKSPPLGARSPRRPLGPGDGGGCADADHAPRSPAAETAPRSPAAEIASRSQTPPEPAPVSAPLPPSYAELLALDAAQRMRLLAVAAATGARRLESGDRELIAWLAAARCALSTQIHRRFHADRSLTATQRQLKRLADRGLLARFQLHRDDGGGIPLCCVVTERALELVGISARRAPRAGGG